MTCRKCIRACMRLGTDHGHIVWYCEHCREVQRLPAGSVLCLFLARSPSAILMRVMAIIVVAFDRHIGRAWSHIAQELREAMFPFVAHRNASATVTSKIFIRRNIAADLCVMPGMIFPRLDFTWGMSMSRESVAPKTPATTNISSAQMFPEHRLLFATVTVAKPISASVSIRRPRNDFQSFKTLTAKINEIKGRHPLSISYAII
jgi:hypothetical protein